MVCLTSLLKCQKYFFFWEEEKSFFKKNKAFGKSTKIFLSGSTKTISSLENKLKNRFFF